jgi:hypothetical protein
MHRERFGLCDPQVRRGPGRVSPGTRHIRRHATAGAAPRRSTARPLARDGARPGRCRLPASGVRMRADPLARTRAGQGEALVDDGGPVRVPAPRRTVGRGAALGGRLPRWSPGAPRRGRGPARLGARAVLRRAHPGLGSARSADPQDAAVRHPTDPAVGRRRRHQHRYPARTPGGGRGAGRLVGRLRSPGDVVADDDDPAGSCECARDRHRAVADPPGQASTSAPRGGPRSARRCRIARRAGRRTPPARARSSPAGPSGVAHHGSTPLLPRPTGTSGSSSSRSTASSMPGPRTSWPTPCDRTPSRSRGTPSCASLCWPAARPRGLPRPDRGGVGEARVGKGCLTTLGRHTDRALFGSLRMTLRGLPTLPSARGSRSTAR